MKTLSKIFEFLKPKKEDSAMTEDEKQEQKAKDGVAEKGADSQSEKDRIDKSVGEQEKKDGNEDSQSAKDRVDKSEGTKEYDEKKAEEKREEKTEEKSEESIPAWAERMLGMIERLTEVLVKEKETEAPAAVGLPADDPARTAGGQPRRAYLDQYRG